MRTRSLRIDEKKCNKCQRVNRFDPLYQDSICKKCGNNLSSIESTTLSSELDKYKKFVTEMSVQKVEQEMTSRKDFLNDYLPREKQLDAVLNALDDKSWHNVHKTLETFLGDSVL